MAYPHFQHNHVQNSGAFKALIAVAGQSLDLSLNNFEFKSTIPSRIGNLTNLSYLNFSNAGFGGQIQKEISHLSRLVTLDLSYIWYFGWNLFEIPNLRMLVGNITKLEEVSLSELYIDSHLQSLAISDTNSSGGRLPPSISNLVQLSTLHVSGYHFSGPLPNSISNLTHPVDLDLSFNNFYGTCLDSITKLKQLTIRVNLQGNNLSGPILDAFPVDCKLKALHGNGNLLTDYDELHLQSALTLPNCTNTVAVRVTNKGLKMDLGKIPKQLGQFKVLIVLNLSNNALSGQIPSSFGNLKQLESLDLQMDYAGLL
nr:receptor-like protein 53 [Ziziphus jujuba var. spinosa]